MSASMTNPARIFNPTQYVMGLGIRLTGALSKGWLMGGRGRGGFTAVPVL
ncbi:hypothetical protein GCM10011505_05490 [Tistrella bauzanensis]|uniref:Uncharacterized protein n=1 Tax=Tistrella bauzanensis TaxID=657419 RepID=A0ABQ1I9M9_9PROT|nr:hypothetical protein GCM10011505_05490 [Tistrella bauzanensis]